ncbi:MAG: thiamine phosphate synthase [Pseudomonadales bacterium]|nr:thiamine phosphate synthase [Pseudomonadales bacterium]
MPNQTSFTKNLRGLYAVTPEISSTDQLLKQVEAALNGGLNLLQYRAKTLPATLRKHQSTALLELCSNFNCPLIINDDPFLAKEIGAQGVHLGQSDRQPALARKLLGPSAIIGITCHDSLKLAEIAQQAGADYLAFGAFYPSTSKPLAKPAQLSILSQAKQAFGIPVVAIGGITLHNAAPLIEAGADMLAVINDLFTHDDIQAQCRRFQALF